MKLSERKKLEAYTVNVDGNEVCLMHLTREELLTVLMRAIDTIEQLASLGDLAKSIIGNFRGTEACEP